MRKKPTPVVLIHHLSTKRLYYFGGTALLGFVVGVCFKVEFAKKFSEVLTAPCLEAIISRRVE